MSTGTTLPIDLIEIVLGDLDDLASLSSCALVCRDWLPSTRRRLFHTLSLGQKPDYQNLIDVLETSPDIADCVRCLELRSSNPQYLVSTDIRRAYAKLFRVVSLKFQVPNVDEAIFTELISSLSAVMMSVKSLSIDCVRFENGDQIGHFISACPLLTELDVSHSGFIEIPVTNYRMFNENLPQVHRPRLHTLRITDCYGDFSRQLIQASMLQLRHLTIVGESFNELHPVLQAIVPETMESLEIAFFGPGSSASDPVISDLCQFPSRLCNLRFFTADVKLYDDHEHESMDLLYATLSNLPPTLVEINLQIELGVGACQMICWESIESIIESRRLVSLRCLVLTFYLYGNGLQVVQELLIKRLSKFKMSKSGLLRIQF